MENENLIKGRKKKRDEKVSLWAYILYFIWANFVFGLSIWLKRNASNTHFNTHFSTHSL